MSKSLEQYRLDPSQITLVGEALSRPECILADRDGTLWIADDRGGVTRRTADGAQNLIGNIPGLPNGLAFDASGNLLVAEIEHGILYRLLLDGRSEIILDKLSGKPLGAVNFVYVDHQGRTWVTVSTRLVPRRPASSEPSYDGYIILLDGEKTRIVADGLCFANEVRVDSTGQFLYVAETALRKISRFRIHGDGSLSDKTTYGPDAFPGRPDGIALDSQGNLWVTEVDNNALWIIPPTGDAWCVFEDRAASVVSFPASLTFAGEDLRTVYLGSLRMDTLPSFRSPIAGSPMSHWGR